MKLLKEYFELQRAIYEYFGYHEDWVVIPLEDQTEDEWMLIGDGASSSDKIVYGPKLDAETLEAGKTIYSGNLYTQRFLHQWVYRGEEYTMICVDTRSDGNKFLMVFSNSKEITDEKLKKIYSDNWGML